MKKLFVLSLMTAIVHTLLWFKALVIGALVYLAVTAPAKPQTIGLGPAVSYSGVSSTRESRGIPKDKQLHIIAGSIIYGVSRVAGASPTEALGLCVLAGFAKEAYDATGRGQVEALDVVATAAPCLLAAIFEGSPSKSARHPAYKPRKLYRDTLDLSPIR